MTARSFTLKDGTVTIRRSDGPPCPAWHCVISRGTSTRAGMAYTARDALRVARGGKAAMMTTRNEEIEVCRRPPKTGGCFREVAS